MLADQPVLKRRPGMSMVLVGRRLSADVVKSVTDNPAAVDALIYGDVEDDDAEMPEPELDLDKSWHGIHYALTGTAWQVGTGAGAAILGGDSVGDDNGYGPPRLISAEQVQSIAADLRRLDVESLRSRWDPAALADADIYPGFWADITFDSYVLPYLAALREFYLAAAAENQAVLLALT